jgi:hypothetical protein
VGAALVGAAAALGGAAAAAVAALCARVGWGGGRGRRARTQNENTTYMVCLYRRPHEKTMYASGCNVCMYACNVCSIFVLFPCSLYPLYTHMHRQTSCITTHTHTLTHTRMHTHKHTCLHPHTHKQATYLLCLSRARSLSRSLSLALSLSRARALSLSLSPRFEVGELGDISSLLADDQDYLTNRHIIGAVRPHDCCYVSLFLCMCI